jgi:hypothetical protein
MRRLILSLARHAETRKVFQTCVNEEIMSEHPSFDRAKGFVALPVEVLEIDLSPGAFRLLVELCRMANADGYCWPSLDQLRDRMGRSKAAISGYVKALRDADLVTTETQKTANGYNYRLKYRVTFWQDWRASLTGTVSQKSERRVQPSERIKTQNQNHLNQVSDPVVCDLDIILKKWARCFKGAPYPLTSKQPTSDLLDETKAILENRPDPNVISAEISAGLSNFWSTLRVETAASEQEKQTKIVLGKCLTIREFEGFLARLKQLWKPHWRKAPTTEQFMSLAKKAEDTTQKQRRTLLQSYQNRWDVLQNSLRPRADFGSVIHSKQVAA